MDDAGQLLRKWRKKPLSRLGNLDNLDSLNNLGSSAATGWVNLDFQRREIELLLPHRDPFLLIDRITCFHPQARFPNSGASGLLVGEKDLKADDPIFAGHFPSYPVYPGALQLEMVGQLALCLSYFRNFGVAVPTTEQQLNIRASKVFGAYYLAALEPGQTVQLLAMEFGEQDGFFAGMIGQVLAGNQVAMVCAQEVCFISESVSS